MCGGFREKIVWFSEKIHARLNPGETMTADPHRTEGFLYTIHDLEMIHAKCSSVMCSVRDGATKTTGSIKYK